MIACEIYQIDDAENWSCGNLDGSRTCPVVNAPADPLAVGALAQLITSSSMTGPVEAFSAP